MARSKKQSRPKDEIEYTQARINKATMVLTVETKDGVLTFRPSKSDGALFTVSFIVDVKTTAAVKYV